MLPRSFSSHFHLGRKKVKISVLSNSCFEKPTNIFVFQLCNIRGSRLVPASVKDAGISAWCSIDVINTSVSVKTDERGDSLFSFFTGSAYSQTILYNLSLNQ